jgi:hypothetical protein
MTGRHPSARKVYQRRVAFSQGGRMACELGECAPSVLSAYRDRVAGTALGVHRRRSEQQRTVDSLRSLDAGGVSTERPPGTNAQRRNRMMESFTSIVDGIGAVLTLAAAAINLAILIRPRLGRRSRRTRQ